MIHKILIVLLTLFVYVFAARDTIITSGKWSVAGTLQHIPTANDTVYKINNGTFNDTMDADYAIKAFICDPSTPGTHWRAGYILTLNGSGVIEKDEGTGTRNYGNGIVINGNGTVYHAATLSTVTSTTPYKWETNGQDSLNLQKTDANGRLGRYIVIGDNARCALVGDGTFYATDTTCLTMGNNATFNNYAQTKLIQYRNGGNFCRFASSNYSITNTGTLDFGCGAAGIKSYMGPIRIIGNGAISFNSWIGNQTDFDTIIFTGVQDYGSSRINMYNNYAAKNFVHIFQSANITCGQLTIGNAQATGAERFYAGTSTINATSYDGSVYNGAGLSSISWDQATINVSNGFKEGTNHTINLTDGVTLNITGGNYTGKSLKARMITNGTLAVYPNYWWGADTIGVKIPGWFTATGNTVALGANTPAVKRVSADSICFVSPTGTFTAATVKNGNGDSVVITSAFNYPEHVAAKYYIDSVSGNDTLNGQSALNAWKTLGNFNSRRFISGDSIFISGSFANQSITPISSGSLNNPIVIKSNTFKSLIRKAVLNGISHYILQNLEFDPTSHFAVDPCGINIDGGQNVTIDNCYLHGYATHCIYIDSVNIGYPQNITVSNCTVKNAGSRNIWINAKGKSVISNCSLDTCGANGISGSPRGTGDTLLIKRCSIKNSGGIGVASASSGGSCLWVDSCQIKNCDGGFLNHATEAAYNKITYTKIESCTNTAVTIGSYATDLDNFELRYDTLKNCTYGLYAISAGSGKFFHNVVHDNSTNQIDWLNTGATLASDSNLVYTKNCASGSIIRILKTNTDYNMPTWKNYNEKIYDQHSIGLYCPNKTPSKMNLRMGIGF